MLSTRAVWTPKSRHQSTLGHKLQQSATANRQIKENSPKVNLF